ncbi:hypothetical protein [Exiguobacterium aurantiacum]|uniref:Uncharacterized protein n=1 Tax=Exiguobacterium aurantiacum TaxID=33987 RepID=A0ABY5FQC0_9BACL|nr:hypothetical protein [Exiguobacterium aurantiacum]UTT43323.1 hypothetical protein NMQ00_02140 [Exiguobacterium aurantiacum]
MANWIVIYLALINFFGIYLFPRDRVPSQKWFSFSSGIAITYFFMYVLPSLNKRQDTLRVEWLDLALPSEIYVISLLGFTVFYGTMRVVRTPYFKDETIDQNVSYWLQVMLLTAYMSVSAYVVTASSVTFVARSFYATALGVHFLAVGHDLYRHYGERYIRQGRYLLSGGILAGGFFSRFIDLASHVEAILFAFVAGAMILNIVKFELPADRNLHFRTFVLAVVGYGGILLFLKHVLNF